MYLRVHSRAPLAYTLPIFELIYRFLGKRRLYWQLDTDVNLALGF